MLMGIGNVRDIPLSGLAKRSSSGLAMNLDLRLAISLAVPDFELITDLLSSGMAWLTGDLPLTPLLELSFSFSTSF